MSSTKEFKQQKTLLFSPVGTPRSGYARYSAAMYFYNLGLLPLELLEIYRRCCKFDFEDPMLLAVHEGIDTITPDELLPSKQVAQ
ncbi:MAG: hypothetical protein ACR2O3_08060 [Rhizobiaceae bacterium]